MLYIIFLSINALLSIALIVLILLNRGRGANAGAAFAGGASATVFGSRGSGSFLTRVIGTLAFLFFANTLLLAFVANRDFSNTGLLDQVERIERDQTLDTPADTPVNEGVVEIMDEAESKDEDASDIPNE